jgi:hypothetical protein
MSASEFITISSITTTGTLGALPRIPVLVTREVVAGFTPDSETGLIKINSTDYESFVTDNANKYGLINALRVTFGQNYFYPFVYILSAPSGVTQDQLSDANKDPRAWSFITYVDRYNGGGTGGAGDANYFTDLLTIKAWGPTTYKKVVINTYSIEEVDGEITLPEELELGGSIGSASGFKTIISNSQSQVAESGGSPIYAYDNIGLAWMSYCINGAAISRSWGSLSDAHDFLLVSSDTYSNTSRSIIENASLAQYNGAKDRANSLFVYDTQMNDDVNPPLTDQIEALLAGYYIDDYVYIYVHNALQAAGQTGLPNDNSGIQTLLGLTRAALNDCYDLNLILSKEDGSPDFSVSALTAAQVTQLSPNWKTSGVWPAGVISATIRRYSAAHYITINFAYQ